MFIFINDILFMVIIMLDKAIKIHEKTKDIEYGWFDKKGIKHNHISEGLAKNFSFQSCEELEKSRVGICWETVELDRKYLEEENIPCKSYFFMVPSRNFYCHSVLVFEDNNKFYWIENSFKKLVGIRSYNSLQELFNDVIDNFHLISNNNTLDIRNMKIYEYTKPNNGIGCVQFYFHCFRGKNVTKKYIEKYLETIEDKNNK